MFNRSPFNSVAFNRLSAIELLVVTLDGVGETSPTLTRVFMSSVTTDGFGEAVLPVVRIQPTYTVLDGTGRLEDRIIRVVHRDARLLGVGEFSAVGTRVAVRVAVIPILLAPNDEVVIDMDKMSVKKNGQSILVDTDFFALLSGVNEITYSDSESSRSVLLQCTKKDRWV